jgi:UDP-glucose 4-epimerase
MTTYGCSKAVSENFVQNIPFNGIKWVCVRYGNVLNSSGSILPHLKRSGGDNKPFTLTHSEMTRFIMTLSHSVNLIEYALAKASHGEIIVPFLYSVRISDLFKIFEEKYNKTTVVTGLRCKEKIHEDLISFAESPYTLKRGNYYHIGKTIVSDEFNAFDSSKHLINKSDLNDYLTFKQYI